MKYILLIGDGMADYPIEDLDNKTPLEAARTPNMDFIAQNGTLGMVKTIPQNMSPASDVATLGILGYDPKKFYTGRGPLEAANLGVEMQDDDVAFRCNLITASNGIMEDYSSGHISSKEAAVIIKFINRQLGTQRIKFYPGVGYRHLMIIKHGVEENFDKIECIPPHDIIGKPIQNNLPKGDQAKKLVDLMNKSFELLQNHEINEVRVDLKENPANMIWLWGQGRKPLIPKFREKFGLSGGVISAVDLIKGLGKIIGLEVISVPGATGYYDTNYEGKAKAALECLKRNDFVFVHVEAPDEAGHNGDLREKITAIERFDYYIVGAILEGLRHEKDFRVLVMPDHATPVSRRTHTAEDVFFGMYGKDVTKGDFTRYCEIEAKRSSIYFEKSHQLIDYLISGT